MHERNVEVGGLDGEVKYERVEKGRSGVEIMDDKIGLDKG